MLQIVHLCACVQQTINPSVKYIAEKNYNVSDICNQLLLDFHNLLLSSVTQINSTIERSYHHTLETLTASASKEWRWRPQCFKQ